MTRASAVVALSTALLLSTVAAVPSAAHRDDPPEEEEVVATGLDNPRGLTADWHGNLYVAESGSGGSEACVEHPEFGEVCIGPSGAVTKVYRSGGQRQVATGLPSVSAGEDADAVGPSDVVLDRRGRLVVPIGLGGNEELREEFGEDGELLGTLVSVRGRGEDEPARVRLIADLAAYETEANPDEGRIDSNPVSVARARRSYVVADAGGNDILRVRRDGEVSTLAVLPTGEAEAPDGTEVEFEPVPTAAVRGPDGAWYVSQLTGFPFPVGGASIYRLDDGELTEWATGLTNVTDLAFSSRGRLYAVQITDEGLLEQGSTGSLVRVHEGSSEHTTVAEDLVAPYGVAIEGRYAYVTTCSICVGEGEVLRVPLRR